MGLDLDNGFTELREHVGHEIVCVMYGAAQHAESRNAIPWNVALECETCGVVLLDFDHPQVLENQPGRSNT